ncbi:MAG TPA: hypothetical protein VFD58_21620 [Blastocatellia bacterium]|nr:hypothetical protein [Blastocatellia bacterium]
MLTKHPDVRVYTISIWTDPDAAFSAVNFDTYENSVEQVEQANTFSKEQYDHLIAEGEYEEAKLFLPGTGRNCNPADFAFRELAGMKHSSFDPLWEERTKGRCWNRLEPALLEAGELALSELADFNLHRDAELSVNSRYDWYDHTWRLKSL